MRFIFFIIFLQFFLFFNEIAIAKLGIRKVSNTSCEIIKVNVSLGMTSQIVFEQEPKVTLYADKKHFKISTTPFAPRSLAIIPFVESSELDAFRDSQGKFPNSKQLISILNESFKTNLFVFFENNNQLMFELRFVEKSKADHILKVKQIFKNDCTL